MKKVRRFVDGGETDDMVAPGNEEAMKNRFVAGMPEEPDRVFAAPDRFSPPAAKPPIVTKEQLEKSGLSLRDYMNAQKGLTRRGGATAMPSNANAAPATPMSTDPSQRTKLKYQSLQDRAEEYAMKNKAAGMGMYGTKKSEPATGNPKRSKNITDMLGLSSNYASGGKVRSASSRADGIAIRGKTRA